MLAATANEHSITYGGILLLKFSVKSFSTATPVNDTYAVARMIPSMFDTTRRKRRHPWSGRCGSGSESRYSSLRLQKGYGPATFGTSIKQLFHAILIKQLEISIL